MSPNLQSIGRGEIGWLPGADGSYDRPAVARAEQSPVAGPLEVVAAFDLCPGDRALEVGGWGLYSVETARRLGSNGQLICMDTEADSLRDRQERVEMGGVAADFIHANGIDLPLRSASLDHVLLIGVLGEMTERTDMLLEFRRVLRSGGRLSVAEPLSSPDSPVQGEIARNLLVAGFVRDAGHDWVAHTSSWRRVA